jgi:DNA polymerase elongation subunit (family B)
MRTEPKIVTFDLETIWDDKEWMQEARAFGMSRWEGRTMKAEINSIITFGYQINDGEPQSISVWDFEDYDHFQLNDDYLLCVMAEEILRDADAIITHNGKRFDFKFLNTRLQNHDLPKVDKVPHIDTCAVAKANYSLFSNSLKDLANFLKTSNKISTAGQSLWNRVSKGDEEAEQLMAEYCRGDVRATYECAIKMRDVTKNWPNPNLWSQKDGCIRCSSIKVEKHGTRAAGRYLKQRYRCRGCGSTWTGESVTVGRRGVG